MALTDESGSNMVMPVSPIYGGGYGNNGIWGGDLTSLLVLFLILGIGGWGGFGMGGFGGGFGNMFEFPWLMTGQQNIQNGVNANTNAGFNQLATQNALSGIQNSLTSGFGDVQLGIAGVNQNICQTGNGIVNALNSGFANAETGANARQMANMQQLFGVNSQIADVKYTVAQENCADRYEAAQNARDIIDAINTKTQGLQDKLCQLELDNYKNQLAQAQRDNLGLQNQLNMQTMQASQTAQTADLRAGQIAAVDSLYNRLSNCPVPCQPVYGNQPIFTCNGGYNGFAA